MSSTVVARSPFAYRVLDDADFVGLVVSALLDDDRGRVRSLCLTSTTVRAAVLASVLAAVQRVRMDAPLPAVLQQMTSLVSLHSAPGAWTPPSCRSSPACRPMGSAALRLCRPSCSSPGCGSCGWVAAADGYGDTWAALHGISCIGSLSSLGMDFPKMRRLPDSIGQLTALTSLVLGGCKGLQQLPDTIGQLTALTSLDLGNCSRLQQLPDTIGQLTALTSLDLSWCRSLQQLPDTIGQLTALVWLDLSSCESLEQLPDTIGQLTALTSLDLRYCDLHQLPDTIGQLTALTSLDLRYCDLHQLPDTIGQLTALGILDLSYYINLKQLPDPICQLPALSRLDLSSCHSLQQLPDNLSQLTALRSSCARRGRRQGAFPVRAGQAAWLPGRLLGCLAAQGPG
jgi:hypothetical protein